MRLLLIEDEPDLGAAIKQTLNHEAYVVDWLLDGAQAWSYLETEWIDYDLAIIDWMLPGLSGIELCKRIRANQRSLPILMLTAKERLEEKVIGLDAGADDYLVKPFQMPELLARLRALRRRSPQIQPSRLHVGHFSLNYGTHSVTCQTVDGKQVIPLTIKEFQLLEYFMKHPNQIVNREQIMSQLWEVGEDPISNVVAAQVRLLRRKLGEKSSASIETIYGVGYRLNA